MAKEEGGQTKVFARWPLLLAAVTLMTAGIGLDLAAQASIAYGLWALASACFGAFLYAEGARHREWTEKDHQEHDNQKETT